MLRKIEHSFGFEKAIEPVGVCYAAPYWKMALTKNIMPKE
jgi:hypothetical protein